MKAQHKLKKIKKTLRKRIKKTRRKILKIWSYLVIIAEFFENHKSFSQIIIGLLGIIIILLKIVENMM